MQHKRIPYAEFYDYDRLEKAAHDLHWEETEFLQSVLFINFMVGIYDGMRAKNLVAILINGVVVLVLTAGEKEER